VAITDLSDDESKRLAEQVGRLVLTAMLNAGALDAKWALARARARPELAPTHHRRERIEPAEPLVIRERARCCMNCPGGHYKGNGVRHCCELFPNPCEVSTEMQRKDGECLEGYWKTNRQDAEDANQTPAPSRQEPTDA